MLTWSTQVAYDWDNAFGDNLNENVAIAPANIITSTFQYENLAVQKDYEKNQSHVCMQYRYNGNIDQVEIHFSQHMLDKMYMKDSGDSQLIEMLAYEVARKHKLPKVIEYKIGEYLLKYYSVGSSSDQKNYALTSKHDISRASQSLPGVDAPVFYPCDCRELGRLSYDIGKMEYVRDDKPLTKRSAAWGIIQHLNDSHKWSREKIADWLDELHDKGEINIEFAPWGEEPVEDENPCADVIPDTWKNIGYTTDPIKFESTYEDDVIKYQAMQHYSILKNEAIIPIITGDAS